MLKRDRTEVQTNQKSRVIQVAQYSEDDERIRDASLEVQLTIAHNLLWTTARG